MIEKLRDHRFVCVPCKGAEVVKNSRFVDACVALGALGWRIASVEGRSWCLCCAGCALAASR